MPEHKVALRTVRTHFLGAGDILASPFLADNSLHTLYMAMPLRPPLASPSCPQSNLASSAAASAAVITAKPKRPRREPSIPKNVRQDVMRFARKLAKRYRPLFTSNPQLKVRVGTIIRALLPPRPRRRGRPRNEETARAR